MESKILVRINNIDDIDKYLEKGICNFLFPLECLSIGYNTFKIDELEEIYKKYNINMHILLNRVLENKDCDELKKLVPKLEKYESIIFEDIAVYQIFKNTKVNLIWNQAHFAVNYHSINSWFNYNIKSCIISNELEKNELNDVLNNVSKEVILPVLGLNMAMYSRRTLLKFYCETFNKEYMSEAIIKSNNVEFLVKENKYGTVYFYNKYFNLLPYLKEIDDNKILYYYIDPNGLSCNDIIDILNGKEIDYENKFYENKTVYKIGDLK